MGGKGSGRKAKHVFFAPAPDREIYDRQPGESDKAWAAFCAYRKLGHERTLVKTALALGKRENYRTTCEGWSRKWGWRVRIEEWERAEESKARDVALAEIEAQEKERQTVAHALWTLAGIDLKLWHRKFERLQEQADAGEEVEPVLSPRELVALAETGIKLARLLEDKPGEIGEHRYQMTVDQKRKSLRALIQRPEVREAMRVIAEAAEASQGDSE